jgi:FkbM family methyltransferase
MIRKRLKRWLYGSCPGFAGSFPYFGSRIYFPKGSLAFHAACEQGIFEADNVHLLQEVVRPGTWFFDVGANIGLMSVPVLHHVPDVSVLSFEPSPNTILSLQRTIAESPHAARWKLVPKAVGDSEGSVVFHLGSPENGLFDGIKSTNRVPCARAIEVELTTIDAEWKRLGSPGISAIKCDVEGAELLVLRGAVECLRKNRPTVLIEWNDRNLKAYGCPAIALLEFAQAEGFSIFALPTLVEIHSARGLSLHMIQTESFLLSPC